MAKVSDSVGSVEEPSMEVFIPLSLYRRIETYCVRVKQQFPNRTIDDYIRLVMERDMIEWEDSMK